MLLMGKSTISTGPFSIAMLNYQRVSTKEGCTMCTIDHLMSYLIGLHIRLFICLLHVPCHLGEGTTYQLVDVATIVS